MWFKLQDMGQNGMKVPVCFRTFAESFLYYRYMSIELVIIIILISLRLDSLEPYKISCNSKHIYEISSDHELLKNP